MRETLEKVTHDLNFARDGLREALKKSNQVEGIVIMGLIGRSASLSTDVERLLAAHRADSGAYKPEVEG